MKRVCQIIRKHARTFFLLLNKETGTTLFITMVYCHVIRPIWNIKHYIAVVASSEPLLNGAPFCATLLFPNSIQYLVKRITWKKLCTMKIAKLFHTRKVATRSLKLQLTRHCTALHCKTISFQNREVMSVSKRQ